MGTRVTSKGQVTIPKAVRDRLNIKPGNAVLANPKSCNDFAMS